MTVYQRMYVNYVTSEFVLSFSASLFMASPLSHRQKKADFLMQRVESLTFFLHSGLTQRNSQVYWLNACDLPEPKSAREADEGGGRL